MVVQLKKKKYVPPVEPTEADQKARAVRRALARTKQKEEAPQAMADYRAEERELRLRTQRLRAERLAREAAREK
jgi:hypothetical protein